MVVAGLFGVEVASELCAVDDCVEVELLPFIRDVNHPSGLLLLNSVANGSEICGVIAEASIGLLDHKGYLAFGHEDALCAVTVSDDATCLEVLEHGLDEGVVERLTLVGDADVKAVVDALELLLRNLAQQLPSLVGAFIQSLQFDHILL